MKLKKGGFDETPYTAVWGSNCGDGAKVAEANGLKGGLASYGENIVIVKSGKFKD